MGCIVEPCELIGTAIAAGGAGGGGVTRVISIYCLAGNLL